MDQVTLDNQVILDRERIVSLVRKWGNVNTDGLLDEGNFFFSTPEVDGFIGYKVASANAIVCGDPVCAPEDRSPLAKAFDHECSKNNLGVVYTIVSEEFAHWATENLSAIGIEFGMKFLLDPRDNPTKSKGSKAVLVRKKVKQALKDGAVVKEYSGGSTQIERQIEGVAEEWVRNRKGMQIYLCQVALFQDCNGKRWFYAEKEGTIVGILLLNELKAKEGWLLNNVMITQDAPKGLSELLVISALEALEREGCHYVLVGPVPSKELGNITGIGRMGANFARLLFRGAKHIFPLDGHVAFWDKFMPQTESSYLVFPHKNLGFSSLKALMQALNVGKGKV